MEPPSHPPPPGSPAAEAQDGEVIQPGRIYIAPGGRHLLIEASGNQAVARLSDDALIVRIERGEAGPVETGSLACRFVPLV